MTERPDWQRAIELLGLSPDGELTTIRLDEVGRISAFIIDSTDAWGRMLTIGNAELAVRMGSHVVDDQRGRVLYLETFEEGSTRWDLSSSGVGGGAAVTPLYSRSGGYSLMLTGGSTLLRAAYAKNYSVVLPNARTGFAYSFALDGPCEEHELTILRHDGTTEHDIRLRYDDTVNELQIFTDLPGYENVWATDLGPRDLYHLHALKLVVDLVNHTYLRLLMDNREIDISGYGYNFSADAGYPEQEIQIRHKSEAAANDVAVIDNVIITTAEPE